LFNKKNSGKSGQGQAKNKKTSALLELNKAPHTLVEMSPRVITRRDGLSSTNLSFLAEASATARVNTTMRTSRTDNQRKGSKIANIVADQGAVVVIRNIDDQKVTKSQHSIHNMQRPSTGKVGQIDQPITYLDTDLRLVSTQSNEIEVKVASASVVPKLLHKLLVSFFHNIEQGSIYEEFLIKDERSIRIRFRKQAIFPSVCTTNPSLRCCGPLHPASSSGSY
jgi:hypothetical protein